MHARHQAGVGSEESCQGVVGVGPAPSSQEAHGARGRGDTGGPDLGELFEHAVGPGCGEGVFEEKGEVDFEAGGRGGGAGLVEGDVGEAGEVEGPNGGMAEGELGVTAA